MSDLSFEYVAGVFPVDKPKPVETRRDLFTGEPIGYARAWDVLPENDDETSRDYWRHSGRATNELLVDYLRTLQDRAADEYLSNPTVEGVIAKHVVDVVGEDAPTLSVEPLDWDDDDAAREYADAVERLWREVADAPTADGEDSFADWIGTALVEDWISGGTIDRIVKDDDVDHPIKSRLQSIDILRLQTPSNKINGKTLLGIERNRYGRPVAYHFSDDVDPFNFGAKFARVPAREIIHGYLKRRRGLVRGYPLLAGVLSASSELRQLDQAVVDAAFNAAMMSVFAYTTSEMADLPDQDELAKPIKLNRRGITRMPAHYQLDTLQSHNSGPDPAFRRELAARTGRPAAMPGLAVNMDASGHNYSSARFDDRGYVRAIGKWRKHCERRRINPYVNRVALEAELRGLVPRRRGAVSLVWQWKQPAGIDPVKDAMAQAKRLENLSTSPLRVAAEEGNDFEQIAREWRRALDILDKYSLPIQFGGVQTYDVFESTEASDDE